MFIKAQRIRTLEEIKLARVDEDVTGEYIGIVDYCLIVMMQLESGSDTPMELPEDKVSQWYDDKARETKELWL
ncbi:DUF1599 domain-containing protein [Mucilaginibacter corticis]|uniref:DUF1599 domain-containing protein n=1 Tax=Mucilaginibacter corticis TaxID=2597670 RepID=UPI001FE272EF|nr:DUF1599 domain-containing protein [Mucilaginibacter corticis]